MIGMQWSVGGWVKITTWERNRIYRSDDCGSDWDMKNDDEAIDKWRRKKTGLSRIITSGTQVASKESREWWFQLFNDGDAFSNNGLQKVGFAVLGLLSYSHVNGF